MSSGLEEVKLVAQSDIRISNDPRRLSALPQATVELHNDAAELDPASRQASSQFKQSAARVNYGHYHSKIYSHDRETQRIFYVTYLTSMWHEA